MAPFREVPGDSLDADTLRDVVLAYGVPSTLLAVSRIARVVGETIDPKRAKLWERHAVSAEVAARAMLERDETEERN